MSQADDGVPQRGNVVDTGEQSVLIGLGDEDDGANALDLHDGGVPKLDGVSNTGIKLREELSPPGHVLSGAGVEALLVDLVVADGPIVEDDMGPQLIEVERSGCQHGRGVRLDAPMYEEQSRLVTLLRLCDMCLIAALRVPTVLGLVVGPLVVIAYVIAGSLALNTGTAGSDTTCLVPLARSTLAAAQQPRSRRT